MRLLGSERCEQRLVLLGLHCCGLPGLDLALRFVGSASLVQHSRPCPLTGWVPPTQSKPVLCIVSSAHTPHSWQRESVECLELNLFIYLLIKTNLTWPYISIFFFQSSELCTGGLNAL